MLVAPARGCKNDHGSNVIIVSPLPLLFNFSRDSFIVGRRANNSLNIYAIINQILATTDINIYPSRLSLYIFVSLNVHPRPPMQSSILVNYLTGCIGRAVTTISTVATDLPRMTVPSTTVARAGQCMFFTNSLAVMVDYRQQGGRIRQSLRLSLRPYQLTWAFQVFSCLS